MGGRVGSSLRRGLACGFALCALAAPAAAHPPPQVFGLKFAEPDVVVLLTNRGFIFGDREAGSWRLMCHAALDINTTEQPELALLPDGALVATTSRGLRLSRDGGCNWQAPDPYGTAFTTALAQPVSDRNQLLLAVYGSGAGGIYLSTDGATSWTPKLQLDDDDFIEELVLAPSAPERLYVSGQILNSSGKFTHYVARSDDLGASVERHELSLLEAESDVVLIAVSPSDPDLVLARTVQNSASATSRIDRLLVSRDAGASFESPLTANTLLAGAFAADGEVIWAAGIEGLWRSVDRGATFTQLPGPNRMTCALEHAGELWACGIYDGAIEGVGISTDRGDSFSRLMAFTDVTSPISCESGAATTAKCEPLWRDWEFEVLRFRDSGTAQPPNGGSAAADAGEPPAFEGSTPARRPRRDTGCSASGQGQRASRTWVLVALALGCLRLRRRRDMTH